MECGRSIKTALRIEVVVLFIDICKHIHSVQTAVTVMSTATVLFLGSYLKIYQSILHLSFFLTLLGPLLGIYGKLCFTSSVYYISAFVLIHNLTTKQ